MKQAHCGQSHNSSCSSSNTLWSDNYFCQRCGPKSQCDRGLGRQNDQNTISVCCCDLLHTKLEYFVRIYGSSLCFTAREAAASCLLTTQTSEETGEQLGPCQEDYRCMMFQFGPALWENLSYSLEVIAKKPQHIPYCQDGQAIQVMLAVGFDMSKKKKSFVKMVYQLGNNWWGQWKPNRMHHLTVTCRNSWRTNVASETIAETIWWRVMPWWWVLHLVWLKAAAWGIWELWSRCC